MYHRDMNTFLDISYVNADSSSFDFLNEEPEIYILGDLKIASHTPNSAGCE